MVSITLPFRYYTHTLLHQKRMLSLNLRITVKVCPQGADMKHNPTSKKTSSLGYLFPSGVFYSRHASDFNFELNEEELIKEALKRGFITAPLRRSSNDKCQMYRYNPDYKPVTAEDVNEVIRDNGTDASEMVQDLVDDELYGEDNV